MPCAVHLRLLARFAAPRNQPEGESSNDYRIPSLHETAIVSLTLPAALADQGRPCREAAGG